MVLSRAMSALTIATLPTGLLAVMALALALAWHVAGAVALVRFMPSRLPASDRMALAWFSWLPISGTVVLALVLLGWASRGLLICAAGLLPALSLLGWPSVRPVLRQARSAWHRWRATATPGERWLGRLGVAMQGVACLFAALPQPLYDQLNYHLLVGHLVVRDGQPFAGAWDPHVGFSGVIEYALAWHRAVVDSRLFFNGVAQAAVMLGTVPVLLWCGLRLGRASLGLFATLLVLLPEVVPESTILRMAKPDGVVLAGVVLLLTLLVRSPEGWRSVAAPVTCLLLASKLTFGHALIGLAAAFAVAKPTQGRIRESWPLLILGALALGLQLLKNGLQFGNPLYPGAASLFPSAASDAWTVAYWKGVAFSGESRLSGWLGPFLLILRRGAPLYAIVILAAAFTGWRWRQQRLAASEAGDIRALIVIMAFLVAYWASWPLFYGGHVLARFVASFSGGLLALFFLCHSRLDVPDRRLLQIACACLGLLTSRLDRTLAQLWQLGRRPAYEAYATQWPRLRTATAINPELLPEDTVVADRPEKVYFDARLLFEEPLSPQERAALEALRRTPVEAAGRYRIKALIADSGRPLSATMQALWRGLEPNGEVRQLGADRILSSPCYFQRPCSIDSVPRP